MSAEHGCAAPERSGGQALVSDPLEVPHVAWTGPERRVGCERRSSSSRMGHIPRQASERRVASLRLIPKETLTVSVVIPALNEAENIVWVLERLRHVDEVIVVDGMSTDGTADAAMRVHPGVRIVSRPPRGKGDALRAGFRAATGDVIVMLDADGSMDPHEIDLFLAVIGHGFDMVKGSREMCGGGSSDLTKVRRLGNRALLRMANHLYGSRWTDFCYGYIAFRRSALPQLQLYADGFEIEAQILTHAAQAGIRVTEIPSHESRRLNGMSHLHPVRDGLRVAHAVLVPRLTPARKRVRANRAEAPGARARESQERNATAASL